MSKTIKNILPPIMDESVKVLIVGSMPGAISLEKQQYYGNKRNHFWPIMQVLFQVEISENYAERIAFIRQQRIGLWDVIQSCERQGSLDSAIKKEVPNDFTSFLEQYPQLELIVFNGGKAYTTFKKYFNVNSWPSIRFEKLPSTSPVPGRNVKSFEEKLLCWREILTVLNA